MISQSCAQAPRLEARKDAINTKDNLHFVAAPVNRLKRMFNKHDVSSAMDSKDGQNPKTADALGVFGTAVSKTTINFAGRLFYLMQNEAAAANAELKLQNEDVGVQVERTWKKVEDT